MVCWRSWHTTRAPWLKRSASVAALLATAATATSAPQRPATRPPAASLSVERGQRAFTQSCAFCHGADARGGAQGGADLLLSAIVLEDEAGRGLGRFLKVGRPEKNMPKFDLPAHQVADIAAFLRSRLSAASSGRPSVSVLLGDAKAGAAYFNGAGRCASCHSTTGDLRGIGKRYEPMALQGRMVVPRGRGGYPGDEGQDKPLQATVTPASGSPVSGDLVYVSDFYVTVKDASGQRHTFIRRGDAPKVEITDPLSAHLALLRTLADKDMHDLTAYLATLK